MQRTTLLIAMLVGMAQACLADGVTFRALSRPSLEVALNPMIDGQIASIDVKEGDVVARDDLLIRLNDDVQMARVMLAKRSADQIGQTERAKIQLSRTRSKLQRLQSAPANSVPRWEIEEATFQVRIAEAELSTATLALNIESGKLVLEEKMLEQFIVKAPFAGRIVEISVDAGATVKRTDVLVKIANTSRLEAIAYIPLVRASALKVGHTYAAASTFPPVKGLPAKLVFLDDRIEQASQTFRAKFLIENADRRVPAGVELTINTDGSE